MPAGAVCIMQPHHRLLPPCAQAANYLNIKTLLDLGCLTVANMIKGAPLHACSAECWGMHGWCGCVCDEFKLPACNAVCCAAAGKTPEEIRKTFNIVVCALHTSLHSGSTKHTAETRWLCAERLHARGGGGGAAREPVGVRVSAPAACTAACRTAS